MKIGLLNLEPKYKNLAIEKLRLYHQQQGDEVEDYFALKAYDKVYCSSIFTFTKKGTVPQGGICGGTGFDLITTLPPEIEEIKPHLNFGFTTRGCIRNCYFCFVPQKEGKVYVVGDVYDIWDGKGEEIILMDNNILALPSHFKEISKQIQKENLRVDFNQGLDHRLITEELWGILRSLKHVQEIRFAFDDIGYTKTVTKALDLMKANGLKDWRTRWYVYISEKDTFETVYRRLDILQKYKQHAYLMRDIKVYDNPVWIALAQWTNFKGAFKLDAYRLFTENKKFMPYAKYLPSQVIKEIKGATDESPPSS